MSSKTTIPFFNQFNTFDSMHNEFTLNLQDSVHGIYKTMSGLFNLTLDNMESIQRYQQDNLSLLFDSSSNQNSSSTKDLTQLQRESVKESRTDIALVTGGTGGIGTVICQRLADDNAKVIATYIKSEKEHAENWRQERLSEGMDVDIIECDVSDFDACKNIAGKLEDIYEHIDVIVNCAGITRDAMLKKLEKENWDAVIQTNLDSVFNVTRNFIDGMIRRGYGRIVNISSVNGQKGQFGQTNYSSAKAGMIGFTRSLAVELANKGITVNCVCPGYVATSMVEAIPEHVKQSIIDQIPLGRLARAEEIADAVGFLAQRESAYITGTELGVNGGLWTG